jgi:hypothetical protein
MDEPIAWRHLTTKRSLVTVEEIDSSNILDMAPVLFLDRVVPDLGERDYIGIDG